VGVLQKGKKKVEEVAAKAKDAVTNGHSADDAKSNGTSVHDEATEGTSNDHAEPGASEEPTTGTAPIEADEDVKASQTPQAVGEAVAE
jgi:hypothetical protein